jgi:nucleotide-binding universal stress UspA family protein
MTKVIAALDNSLAARPVVATATALGGLLGAEVEALHVGESGDGVAGSAAAAAGLALCTCMGPTVERLVESGSREDVVAMVLGARGTPGATRPVGATALEVLGVLPKPLVVVPPEAASPGTLRRILVPLEGTVSTSLAPKGIFELAQGAELEVVVLHVHDEASLPLFTDQPQHETSAWAREFLARYCPWGVGDVRLEIRVGRRDEQILSAAEETGADLIALGWSQELARGRAPVVRAALERGHVPVLLVPVHVTTPVASPQATEKEELCSSWPSLSG